MVLTLLVMTVLSMTTVTFLVLGDTEVRLSRSDRDACQPLYIAEGVVEVVRSWFDDPDPASNPLVPSPDEVEREHRRCDLDWDGFSDEACNGSLGNGYRGGRASGTPVLFDKPYRHDAEHTFWGWRDTPEILIRETSPGGYLERLNHLFGNGGNKNLEGVRVVEIRVFAPRVAAEMRLRLGVATVEVTVDKFRGGLRVARRRVRANLSEIPYPGPQGALESEGTIEESGSAGVHWGAVVSEGDIRLPRSDSRNFPQSALPRRQFSALAWEDFSPGAVDRTLDLGDVWTQGTQNTLTELLGLSVEGRKPHGGGRRGPAPLEDPWLRVGALGSLWEGNEELGSAQPWPYIWRPGNMVDLQEQEDRSHLSGGEPVQMTPILYETWKAVAMAGGRGIHYLTFSRLGKRGEPLFRLNGRGRAESFAWWTNSELPGHGAGLFFFDTVDQEDPQKGDGILTPPVRLNASRVPGGGAYLAKGFIYLNAESVSSTGMAGKSRPVPAVMPGEPFLDGGLDLNHSGFVGDDEAERELAENARWDCDCDGDGDVDDDDAWAVFTAHRDLAPGGYPDGYEDPRLPREDAPYQLHEPFLNLDYPDPKSSRWTTRVDYSAQGDPIEDMDGDGEPSPGIDRLTTLGRDADGGLFPLRCNVWGVFYNEGRYAGSGNIRVYGSMLMREGFSATGSPEIWFDESLAKGAWPPRHFRLPRVTVTALYDAPR